MGRTSCIPFVQFRGLTGHLLNGREVDLRNIDPCHVSSVTNIDLRARLERDVKFGRQLSKRDAGGLGGRMWSELNEIEIKRGRMPSNLAISGLRWPKPSANHNPPLSHH